MTRSRSAGLAKLPKDQVCSFLIGPASSWFKPNAIDLWTKPRTKATYTAESGDPTPCDPIYISYFVYGSLHCFCVGEIQHRPAAPASLGQDPPAQSANQVGAVVNRLVDVDSRVVCVRFQKDLPVPMVLALTESESIIIYDLLQSRNLVHLNKAELFTAFIGPPTCNPNDGSNGGEVNNKRHKGDGPQHACQVNSCTWPDANNVFLGIFLPKEKKHLLVRLRLKDIVEWRKRAVSDSTSKCDLISLHQKIELDFDNCSNEIKLIESAMLDDKICLVAVAVDKFITVTSLNLEDGRTLRTIKLNHGHDDEICSMSLYMGNTKRHPLGLLASVLRGGRVLIWDIENEFYFADYLAHQDSGRNPDVKIDWFALRFIHIEGIKRVYLAISNVKSGVTLLEIPEKTRPKVRLREPNQPREITSKSKRSNNYNADQEGLRHNALIFNIEYDPLTRVLMTSSLDGNLILWKVNQSNTQPGDTPTSLEVKQQFLIPAMPRVYDKNRTHDKTRTHMLRHNPIREDLLCMALDMAGVRFHSISNRNIDSKYEMTPTYSLVARKLTKSERVSPTSIAWHPNHEYRLALGTREGKIYRVDITPRKATLVECKFVDKIAMKESTPKTVEESIGDINGVECQPMDTTGGDGQRKARDGASKAGDKTDGVYSICWGPNPSCSDDITKHAIYAIGSVSQTLFIYYSKKDNSEKLTNYLDEFLDTSLPEAAGAASDVSWKSSMDLMALGTTDGRVLIVTYLAESHQERSNHKLFRRLMTIQGPLGSGFVKCIAWHPTTDKDDPNYYKIAVSSKDSSAYVFDLKMTLSVSDLNEQLKITRDSGNTNSAAVAVLASYANKLEAHEKAITDISWNPHEPSQLATCSFDRTCYVWSLDGSHMDARVIARFCARDSLFTVDWSLVDENLVYTSGKDSIVWAWRPTENRFSVGSV